MAGWSFAFDPETNDLIDDGKGGFVRTYHADTHVQLQMQCHAGECWQDELLGSRLFQPAFFQRNPLVSLPDEIKRALGVLQARKLIDNIAVTAQQITSTRVDVTVSFRDVSTGTVITRFLTAGG